MTTPDTKMLSAEEMASACLRKIAREKQPDSLDFENVEAAAGMIDALTARVAELERERDVALREAGAVVADANRAVAAENKIEGYRRELLSAIYKLQTAEGKLAAARAPVEESEIAAAVRDLTNPEYTSSRRNEIAILITRLARERAEARSFVQRIAEHPSANVIVLGGKPMIGAGTAAKDVLAALKGDA